jgi:hypothetical protein
VDKDVGRHGVSLTIAGMPRHPFLFTTLTWALSTVFVDSFVDTAGLMRGKAGDKAAADGMPSA